MQNCNFHIKFSILRKNRFLKPKLAHRRRKGWHFRLKISSSSAETRFECIFPASWCTFGDLEPAWRCRCSTFHRLEGPCFGKISIFCKLRPPTGRVRTRLGKRPAALDSWPRRLLAPRRLPRLGKLPPSPRGLAHARAAALPDSKAELGTFAQVWSGSWKCFGQRALLLSLVSNLGGQRSAKPQKAEVWVDAA